MLYLPGFVGLMPMDRDEPRFAQATKQMLETGDFVAPRFQDDARNKKPAGIYWLQAIVVQTADVLGIPDARHKIYLYRIPSLLGAILSVLLTYRIGLMVMSRRGAFVASVLLACCLVLGVEARLAKTDAVVTASVILSMAAVARLWQALHVPKTLSSCGRFAVPLLFWGALAVGVLVKGPVTPLVVGLTLLMLSLHLRDLNWLRPLRPIWGLLGFACFVMPWFVLIGLRTGGGFFSDAIGGDMLQKVAGGVEQHGAPPGSYFALSWFFAWPLIPFVALVIPQIWNRRRDETLVFLLAWLLPNWLLFELVPTKLPHYVMPLLPALALLVGAVVETEAVQVSGALWRRTVLLFLPLLVMVVLGAGLGLCVWFGLAPPLVLDVALGFSVVLLVWMWRLQALTRAHVVACSLALTLTLVVPVFHGLLTEPFIQPFALSPRLAAGLAVAKRDTGCSDLQVASISFHEPSFVFLTRTDLLDVDEVAAAHYLMASACRAVVVPKASDSVFLQAVQAANTNHITIENKAHVSGYNINKMNQANQRFVDLNIYVRGQD